MTTANSRRAAWVLAFTVMVTTCSTEQPSFYDPRTGAIGECQSTDFDPYGDKCIATYEKSGWIKYDKPIISREAPPRTSSP